MKITTGRGLKVLGAAMSRVSDFPPPAEIRDAVTVGRQGDGYDDFQYVDCPYDDYKDKI